MTEEDDVSDVESVHALLPEDGVEEVVAELRRHGIHADEIHAEPAPTGRWMLRDEELHEDAAGARHGAELGFLVGLVVGLAAALVVTVIRDAGAAAWAVSALGGGGFGAIIGAMTGLQRRDPQDDDPVRFHDVTEDSGLWVLSVDSPRWSFRAHRLLEGHGVEFIEYETPAARI
ncbi:MAG TPA: hypothetical protein VGA69_05450 [Nitriliruptorales bacterium]